MASPIDALKSAGFDDDEISSWATQRRDVLTNAGFKDNEADAYFTGGVTAPEKPPDALIDRLKTDLVFGKALSSVFSATGTTPGASRVVTHTWDAAATGYGNPTPTGFDDKTLDQLVQLGIFHDPVKGRPGPIQILNESVMIPTAQLLDRTLRGINAGIHGAGGFLGQVISELGGEGPKAEREVVNFANWAMIETGFGRFSRPRIQPHGPVNEPIGGLPKADDFVNAAKVVADDTAPKPVQEKLLRLYNEDGRLPSEIAADAQHDPVIAQRLLSKDAQDLPYRETQEIRPVYDLSEVPDGYQFNPYEPVLPAKIEAARKSFEDLGIEARQADSLFSDITGKKALDAPPIAKVQTTETSAGPPGLFGDFEIKSLEPVKEQLPPREGTLQTAQEEVANKISIGERQKKTLTLSKAYTEAIDDLHPLKAVSEDAYQMARLTRGQFAKAGYFLEQATFDFNTYKNTGPSLRSILEPVKNDMDELRVYLASKRALEIEESGRVSGIDFLAARQVVSEVERAGSNRAFLKDIAREIVGYQNRVLQYLKDSGVLTDEAYTAMVEANKNYVPFYRVIQPEASGVKGGKSFGPMNPIKKLVGSERAIIDPIESIIKNTYAYVSIAERNAVGIELVDALKAKGSVVEIKPSIAADAELVNYLRENGVTNPEKLAEFVQHAAPEDGTMIRAFRNGIREEVKVSDPELVAAFRGVDRQSVGLLTKIFSVPARTLRAGAVLTPDFIARNLLRDFLTAFVNTKGAVFSPVDTLKGLAGVIRKDADWENWIKAGGANSTMVALDRAYLQESLATLNNETGLLERSWNLATAPIRGLRMVSELAENATRLGEFKKLASGENIPKDVMQSAAYSSREVTLDFARMGARMKSYNMLTAFANAQVQGVDRLVRALKDNPLETSMRIAGSVTLPSILLWWANHGDQRYEELPNWQKDLFWIILTDSWQTISESDASSKPSHLVRNLNGQWQFNNGSIYRIPKPFEIGVLFGSGPELLLDATIGKNPEAFNGFTKSVVQAFTPSFLPTVAQPAIEQFANRSTFTDRTLIPADVEKQLPEYQYTPYTTQLSRKLGQVISSFPGMHDATRPDNPLAPVARALSSPILIENYIRSWTGGLGMYALEAADAALRKTGVLPDPIRPTATLADIPFVKAFVVRYPSATTQSLQDFHDEYHHSKVLFDTWMARAKEGDVEAMNRVQAIGGPQMMLRLDEINSVLSEHSKLIRDIYKNAEMPADEKRQLIDSLYYGMIQIGRAGRDMQRAIGKSMAPTLQ